MCMQKREVKVTAKNGDKVRKDFFYSNSSRFSSNSFSYVSLEPGEHTTVYQFLKSDDSVLNYGFIDRSGGFNEFCPDAICLKAEKLLQGGDLVINWSGVGKEVEVIFNNYKRQERR